MAEGPPAFPKEIRELAFFYDNFANSEEAANHVIRNNKGQGTFLLRPSFRTPGLLTLTISTDDGMVRHVNVQFRADERRPNSFTFFIIPENPFPSFHDLYAYYSINTICNVERVDNVRLINPIERFRPSPGEVGTASTFPRHGPMVTSDEIPPIPRKASVSSWTGSTEVVPTFNEEVNRGRSRSQLSFSDTPPSAFITRSKWPSLDSQGNDNAMSGSSGSGSEVVTREGRALNGHGLQPTPYLALGRPDTSKNISVTGVLPPTPQHSQPTPISPPAPLSKKELKELKEQKEKQKKLDKKNNKIANKHKKKMENITSRAPMPIPEVRGPQSVDEPPYYSTPKPHKNKIDELKKMLRESEMCDCGLRMMDAELVQGWTVHRSRDSSTLQRVFYQHDDGSTTWHFPDTIAEYLTNAQVQFIARLCHQGSHDIPHALIRRYQTITSSEHPQGAAASQSSSFSSNNSRSNSTSSDQFGSNQFLSSRPLPKPGS